MTFDYHLQFLRALLLSVSLEFSAVLAMLLLYRHFKKGIGFKYTPLFIRVSLATAITIPFVWYVFPLLQADYQTRIYLSESFAVSVEGLYYALSLRCPLAVAMVLSLVANMFSYLVGPILLYS